MVWVSRVRIVFWLWFMMVIVLFLGILFFFWVSVEGWIDWISVIS